MKNLTKSIYTLMLILMFGALHAQSLSEINAQFELDATPMAKIKAESSFLFGKIPDKSFEICSEDWVTDRLTEINRELKTSQVAGAIVYGKLIAEAAAGCALVTRDKTSLPGEIGKPGFWAKIVGEGLFIGITHADEPGGGLQPLNRAIAYFNYAKNSGDSNVDGFISKLEKIKSMTGPQKAPTTAEVSTNAKTFVAELKSNSFGFWKRYETKAVSITGTIQKIVEMNSGGVSVKLDGRANGVSIDDATINDYIYCDISDKTEIDKVVNLKKGQTTRLIGVVRHGLVNSIDLIGCAIR